MAEDIDKKFADTFEPHTAGSLTDERGLYGEFRAFRAEMRTAFELLTAQFMPFMNRTAEELADLRERVATLEAEVLNASGRRRAKR